MEATAACTRSNPVRTRFCPYTDVTLEPHFRRAPRRLRHHGTDRRRRHGPGVPGDGHEAETSGRHQDPAAGRGGHADRLARFQREAEVLASLNHPNIAGIYGLEETGGLTALVMELVEGDDLSQRIARGAIPIDEALPIAKQIAEALEAAHEQGIIHRDLKPANIKVRPDGTVKVLDFGLAKAMEPAGAMSPSMSMSPTITTPAMTQAGIILGTAAYMSPEQAKGREVDKRSDIWSFGCVLYRCSRAGACSRVTMLRTRWQVFLKGSRIGLSCLQTCPYRFGYCCDAVSKRTGGSALPTSLLLSSSSRKHRV